MKTFFRCIVVVSIAVFCLTGCATMFTDKTQQIYFKTKPEGAEVALGTKTCITPCSMQVEKGKWTLHVIATKPGYDSQSTALGPALEPWIFANAFNFGIGVIIDIATGTYLKYETEYYIPMTKKI